MFPDSLMSTELSYRKYNLTHIIQFETHFRVGIIVGTLREIGLDWYKYFIFQKI